MSNIRATFSINAAGTVWGAIEGSLANQTDLQNALNLKANASTVAGIQETIGTYGDIVTYNASAFATSSQGALADTALQPNDNISEMNNNVGYITSDSVGNGTLTIQKNSTTVGTFDANQSTNKTINISVPTSVSEISTTDQLNAINSGATTTNIGQIATNTSDISTINGKIPTQASSSNQLADKQFVNSSISTNTANFIGTFDSVAELEAYSGTLTNNDYAFVVGTDSDGNTVYNRYKYTTATTPASWEFEYALNNSSFTSAQWDAINSGITSGDVALIGTAIQPNDNISTLNNDAGFITSSAVGTGTLTIQKNGTDVQTFNANASSNATANIIVPTKISDLTDDTATTPIAKANTLTGLTASITELNYTDGVTSAIQTQLNGKQATLVSGTNIKTVNSTSLLGSGDIPASDPDLSNLSNTGEERLHALKSYEDAGELLTDAEGLADVKNYAHSTFDRSKFTVVGSPVITDDGLLYPTIGNGLYASSIPFDNKSFEFKYSFTPTGTPAQSAGILTFYNGINLYQGNNGGFSLTIPTALTGLSSAYYINVSGVTLNVPVILNLTFNSNTLDLTVSFTQGTTELKTQTITLVTTFASQAIYMQGNWGSDAVGYIDLKYLSVMVNGIPVFSGNKTGIDTIKPDDYTVVGTPTISADGVFTSSQYADCIQVPTDIVNQIIGANSWRVEFEAKMLSTVNSYAGVLGRTDAGNEQILSLSKITNSNTNLGFYAYLNIEGTPTVQNLGNPYYVAIPLNENFKGYIEYDGSNNLYSWGITKASGNASGSLTSSYKLTNTNTTWHIGRAWGSPIDLNAFRVYINGDLVYQPCLKIPYTFSKTGSKIVDYIYRDRVNDMYNQFGYSNYYTLQEDNVPNYSVVGSPTISSDYVASGFSGSNYLTLPVTGNDIKPGTTIYVAFTTNSVSAQQWLIDYTTLQSLAFEIINSKLRVRYYYTSSEYGLPVGANNLQNNTTYLARLEYYKEGATYNVDVYLSSDNGTTWVKEISYNSPSALYTTNANMTLGGASGTSAPFLGSLDLNSFKIYIDNKLTYQAVIPPCFTLPQGELYGRFAQTLRNSTRSGINRSFLYSDRTQWLTGSCTSGTEVTLARPFSDSNYMLSVPYSAKSATAFTPTQTGDWFAIGEGAL